VTEIPNLVDIITCTTRLMRKSEREGCPYHFLSQDEFKRRIEDGYFVEWAEVHGQLYGTPRDQIARAWKEGRALIMDVDVQGAQTFLKKYPKETMTIFILPPSIDELRQRVIKRDGDTIKDLDLRMKNAAREIAMADQFHYQMVNDEFESAYAHFKKLVEEIIAKR